MTEENKNPVVYENTNYEVRAGQSPFKFHRYAHNGDFIDAGDSYQIYNKKTGNLEEETSIFGLALGQADRMNDEILNHGTLNVVGMNDQAAKIVQ